MSTIMKTKKASGYFRNNHNVKQKRFFKSIEAYKKT